MRTDRITGYILLTISFILFTLFGTWIISLIPYETGVFIFKTVCMGVIGFLVLAIIALFCITGD